FLQKRENTANDWVKLLDFGIAKVRVDSDLTAPTKAGTLLGTPHYMSPEQFLGETTLDARADLWSVAVVAYRALVGHSPFTRGPAAELAARVLGSEPAPPSSLVPSLPAAFDAWIKKGMAKRAEDRFENAAAMSAALAGVFELSSPTQLEKPRRAK